MDGIKPRRPGAKKLVLPKPAARVTAPLPKAVEVPAPSLALPVKKTSGWKWFWIILGSVVAVCAIVAAATFWWYKDALQPRSQSATPVAIVVEQGASVDHVATELEQKSVIKNRWAFIIYTRLHSKTSVQTGSYMFAPNQPVAEIVAWLNEGKVSTRKVTILPGKTIKQLRESLIKDGYSEVAVDAALAKTYDHPLLADKPAGASLEGYLFPETYFVNTDATPEELFVKAFDEFEKRIEAEGLRDKLAARGFTLFQGITLASIVARETSNEQDQRQAAQVFETRLAIGMVLGSDVTYHYAAEQMGVAPAVNLDSLYNTRIHGGLPPGPIANFNLNALKAVAEPATGDYLYFVAGDDGVTHFSHTFEEHERNIQQFCKKLCLEP